MCNLWVRPRLNRFWIWNLFLEKAWVPAKPSHAGGMHRGLRQAQRGRAWPRIWNCILSPGRFFPSKRLEAQALDKAELSKQLCDLHRSPNL